MQITPHKNAEWIKLWADGYSVEWLDNDNHWHAVTDKHAFKSDAQYRVSTIKELPIHTIQCFKEWVIGFFDALSNAETFDYDYWTGWRRYYDINIYNSLEDIDDPKDGYWTAHLMQGYPGNAGYETLVSVEVRWDSTEHAFVIKSDSIFVTVTNERDKL